MPARKKTRGGSAPAQGPAPGKPQPPPGRADHAAQPSPAGAGGARPAHGPPHAASKQPSSHQRTQPSAATGANALAPSFTKDGLAYLIRASPISQVAGSLRFLNRFCRQVSVERLREYVSNSGITALSLRVSLISSLPSWPRNAQHQFEQESATGRLKSLSLVFDPAKSHSVSNEPFDLWTGISGFRFTKASKEPAGKATAAKVATMAMDDCIDLEFKLVHNDRWSELSLVQRVS
jgi:hypothetical protein